MQTTKCECCGNILIEWPIRTSVYAHADHDSNLEQLSEALYEEGVDPQEWLEKNKHAAIYVGYEIEIVLDLYEDGTYKVVNIRE